VGRKLATRFTWNARCCVADGCEVARLEWAIKSLRRRNAIRTCASRRHTPGGAREACAEFPVLVAAMAQPTAGRARATNITTASQRSTATTVAKLCVGSDEANRAGERFGPRRLGAYQQERACGGGARSIPRSCGALRGPVDRQVTGYSQVGHRKIAVIQRRSATASNMRRTLRQVASMYSMAQQIEIMANGVGTGLVHRVVQQGRSR
jgi:hypothetical protein